MTEEFSLHHQVTASWLYFIFSLIKLSRVLSDQVSGVCESQRTLAFTWHHKRKMCLLIRDITSLNVTSWKESHVSLPNWCCSLPVVKLWVCFTRRTGGEEGVRILTFLTSFQFNTTISVTLRRNECFPRENTVIPFLRNTVVSASL